MAAKDLKKLKVLVLDDDKITRMVVERMFTKRSCKAKSFFSGYEVLEYLRLGEDGEDTGSGVFNDVDLIVTDHDMKEMSGLQLLRILKKSTTRNDIPVAFMSAGDVPERIKCCKDEGAIEYFIKPLKKEHVEHLINIIAEKKM